MKTPMRKYAAYLLIFLVTASNAACKKKSEAEGPKDEEGYVTGKITDTQGGPLPGIEVVVENILVGNHSHVDGVTDDKGFYKIKLPTVGTYHASAYIKKTFNGKNYEMSLHPDNDEVFGNTGSVVNFQWKLSGPRPAGLD